MGKLAAGEPPIEEERCRSLRLAPERMDLRRPAGLPVGMETETQAEGLLCRIFHTFNESGFLE